MHSRHLPEEWCPLPNPAAPYTRGDRVGKAKRRQFNRGYAPNPPSGRYSYQHQQLAKVVTMNAACSLAHLGGCDGPLEADHIVPRDAGGQSTMENLRPLCRRHNRQRGNEYRNQKSK